MRCAAAVLMTLAAAAPAFANDIGCTSADSAVSLVLTLSPSNMLDITAVALAIGEERWSSDSSAESVQSIVAGQGLENLDKLLVDFAARPGGAPIAWLRAFSTSENGYYASGGVFGFAGKGAWVVDCSDRE